MLDALLVEGRRIAYLCCAGEYAEQGLNEGRIFGDIRCAEKYERKSIFYLYAASIMQRTPLSTDDECCVGCVTDAFALEVIKRFDPNCVRCGCDDPDTRPVDCEVVPDTTVYRSADASLQDILQPVIGAYFLITTDNNGWTGGWETHLGEIAVSDGTTWTYTVPTPGDVIYDAFFGVYYVAYAGGAGAQYPTISGTQVGPVLTLSSSDPGVSGVGGRDIVVQGSTDGGTTWLVPLYTGPESAFTVPVPVTVAGTVNMSRTYYYTNDFECRYGPFESAVPPPPDPIPTFSIRLLGGGPGAGYSLLTTLPTGTTDFYPWNEAEFVISFNMRVDSFSPINVYIPVSMTAQVPGPVEPYITATFLSQTALHLGTEEYGVVLIMNDTGGTEVFRREIVFPGAWAIISDGAFHHVSIVRNSAAAGGFEAADLTMWVGGIGTPPVSFAAANRVAPFGVSYAAPIGLTYATPGGVNIGDAFAFPMDVTVNNLYMAKHAPTAGEILTVCYPADYALNDALWGRALWIRAQIPDDPNAPPWVNSYSPLSVFLMGMGDTTLVPDTPPWVV